jgi:heterotetrameric sarcosine oxidase alpha subunit
VVNPPGLRQGTRLGAARVRFTFDGRDYAGQIGDTAASALLANGVRAMGRSMKYRRLRGVLTAGPEEPCALLTVGTPPAVIPNVCAPQLVLRDGLVLRSQNRWPTLHFDLASLLQWGGGLLGAGFYYKTFLWPSWHVYEPMIRRLAGLGEAPGRCDLPVAVIQNTTCDVLVAGAGAAGLAAAGAAARAGASVIVCEREPLCGGELEFEDCRIAEQAAPAWLAATLADLRALGVRVLTDTALLGGSGGTWIAMTEPGGLPGHSTVHRIRARALVLATGAVEQPIAFVDNDLPGVMLVGAAERYLARYGTTVGQDLVLFSGHDRMYASARRLLAGGMRVRAVVDSREKPQVLASGEVRQLRAALERSGVDCLCGHAVVAADGGRAVQAVRVAPLAAPGAARTIACDTVLVSGGWSPQGHAGAREGGAPQFVDGPGAGIAVDPSAWRAAAGAANGRFELGAALADGHAAGVRAARHAGACGQGGDAPGGHGDPEPRLVSLWRSPAPRSAEKHQFVDLQNDVTVADVRQALAEGFRDIEHLKRYTALGMGTEQGRTSSLVGSAVLAQFRGEPLAQVGLSRSRMPYQPVTMHSIAGLRTKAAFRVARRTPLHDWHEAHGGVLDSMGLWMRPRYYRGNGAGAFEAAIAEAGRVRAAGGMADASTLGKIEFAGADAAAFLDQVYLTRASSIGIGRARYMVNLREDAMVLDDGILLRLDADRFRATTSSAHAEHMLAHFEFARDTGWEGRAVTVTDVTEAWAVICVAGPGSRAALHAVLGHDWRQALERLGHMAFATGLHAGHDLTVVRAGYSGELAFELHCRPQAAVTLWEALAAQGLAPYGIEALDILRVEKGYLSSSEINGRTTPLDLGMEPLVKQANACLGRELLDRPAFQEPARPCLVGLRAVDGSSRFLAGAQLTTPAERARPCGYVTSAVFSPSLGQWVGLALVARTLATHGTRLTARDPLRQAETAVQVTAPVHFDPAGERLKS